MDLQSLSWKKSVDLVGQGASPCINVYKKLLMSKIMLLAMIKMAQCRSDRTLISNFVSILQENTCIVETEESSQQNSRNHTSSSH